MTWLDEPLARIAGLIEGRYPATPLPGRSVPAGRHRGVRLHGDMRDAAFPSVHYHRAYELAVERSGGLPDDPPNLRAGSQRHQLTVVVSLGYLIGRDAPAVGTGACGTRAEALQLAAEDHQAIVQAMAWPGHWSGTSPSIALLQPSGDTYVDLVVPGARLLVSQRWSVLLTFAPGTVW